MRRLIDRLSSLSESGAKHMAYVFPEREAWPIHGEEHALIAIRYMKAGRGNESDYPTIKKAIRKRHAKNERVIAALDELG